MTSYTCPFCGMVSHNPNDALHRYCGACHRFADDAAELIQRAAELIKTSANLGGTGRSLSQLEAIAEAIAAERERCAKLIDASAAGAFTQADEEYGEALERLAAAIRAPSDSTKSMDRKQGADFVAPGLHQGSADDR